MPQSEAKIKLTLEDHASSKIESVSGKFKNFGKSMASVGGKMSLFVTGPLAAMGGIALKNAADFEKQQVAFETMLGSQEKARDLLQDIIDFSAKTPFQLPGLQDAAKRLLGFGVAAENVVQVIQNLGNVAQGDQQRLERLTLAFGKLRAKGKATLEELNMFLEAGVPILDELSGMYGVTTQEMFEMISAGEIGFEDVNKALTNLSTGTGQFAGMLEKQSRTFSGMLSTLKDNFGLLGMELAQTVMPQIKAFLDKALGFVKRLRDMDEDTKKMIVKFAVLAGVIGPLIAIFGMLAMAIGAIISPVGLVIAAIAAAGAAAILLYKNWESVVGFLTQLWHDMARVFESIWLHIKDFGLEVLRMLITPWIKAAQTLVKVFGGSGEKLQGILDGLDEKGYANLKRLEELQGQAWETADEFRNFGEKMKDLGGKVKNLTGELGNLIKGGMSPEAALAKIAEEMEKLNEATEVTTVAIDRQAAAMNNNKLNMAGMSEVMIAQQNHYSDWAAWVGDSTDEAADALEELYKYTKEEFAQNFALTLESVWTSSASFAEKIKETIKSLIADILRGFGREQAALAAALMFVQPFAALKHAAAAAAYFTAAGVVMSLAQGGEFVTNGPQMIMVGDNPSGRERVSVEPMGGGGGDDKMVHTEIYLDGQRLWRAITKATKDKKVLVHQGAIVSR